MRKWQPMFLTMALLLSGCGGGNAELTEAQVTAVYAEVTPSPEVHAALSMAKLSGGDLDVRYERGSKIPWSIKGRFSERSVHSAEDALAALLDLRDVMQIEGESFCLLSEDSDRAELCVYTFGQLCEGILVDNGGFRVVVTQAEGTPYSVTGRYVPGLSMPSEAVLSAEEARPSVSLEKKQRIAEAALVFGSTDAGDYRLCWRFRVTAQDPLQSRYSYVDAVNGTVVSTVPLAIS